MKRNWVNVQQAADIIQDGTEWLVRRLVEWGDIPRTAWMRNGGQLYLDYEYLCREWSGHPQSIAFWDEAREQASRRAGKQAEEQDEKKEGRVSCF